MPYFVFTVQPSTIGKISLCTPSLLTSGPLLLPELPAILSISSIKIIPSCSARLTASAFTVSMSIILSHSSWFRISRASRMVNFLFFFLVGNIPPIISPRLISIPAPGIISKDFGASLTSISTKSSSYFPSSIPFWT